MKKIIVLDRDGVINFDSPHFIKSPDEWVPIPGSLEAIARLKHAHYQVVIATNQSGIARGLFNEAMLANIHAKMQQELADLGVHIDGIFYCPHGPDDQCSCRKPKTGLFEQIAVKYQVSLLNIPAIGDSLRDIQAAQSAGCHAILVRTGKGETTLKANPQLTVPVFADLAEAVNSILAMK